MEIIINCQKAKITMDKIETVRISFEFIIIINQIHRKLWFFLEKNLLFPFQTIPNFFQLV